MNNLNLIPYHDDEHIEVRQFADGINHFTGICLQKVGDKWGMSLNDLYTTANKVRQLNGKSFPSMTAALAALYQALAEHRSTDENPPKESESQDDKMLNIVNNENLDPELREMALEALWGSARIKAKTSFDKEYGFGSSTWKDY